MCSRVALTVLALFLVMPVSTAQAGGLDVTPVRVHLSAAKRSTTIVLRNQGSEPLRYQLTAHEWRQHPDGTMVVAPSRDLVLFPSLVELKPGASRRLKVAAAVAPGGIEKSYRVFLEPLPIGVGPARAAGTVRVLTRISIPVFLQPAAPTPQPDVRLRVQQGRLVVSVGNAGNSYFMTRSIHLVGHPRTGFKALDQIAQGWYVLARNERVYDFPLSPAACAGFDSIDATVKTETTVVRSRLALSPSICGGPAR